MSIFLFLRLDSIAWSLRKLYCPVNKKDLVLEVGSGGSPYFRSNILCDPFKNSQERFFEKLVTDRITVNAFGESLPFKNKSFDFLIASHVLEHTDRPEAFIEEMQRVSKAGYIEVPDAFFERLTHYTFHKLEIYEKNGELKILKKKNFIHDNEVVGLFKNKAQEIFPKWVKKYPFNFHVRYYWSENTGGIKYKIINKNQKSNWTAPKLEETGDLSRPDLLSKLKKYILKSINYFLLQSKRNKNINLQPMLQCRSCKKKEFLKKKNFYICKFCKEKIEIYNP